ncbi:MAG: glucosyl-3-phosphoglycerate synthase [Kamptonema sp. SIO4C4]|nr:glucosyl-3-phosphoglycerate synthase [Kamptonema sp. SIO4C4]
MDYKQELITTIHDYGCNLNHLERRLLHLSETSPTALIIPALYEELQRPALSQIREQLQDCHFVKTIVVCLFATSVEQYQHAVEFFSSLPQKVFVLWENGERVMSILHEVRDRGLDLVMHFGKGIAVWFGLGIASLEADAIAVHDADILTYDRSYPLKLLYPLLEKEFGIAFNKAYYARISGEPSRFHGRVVRLFVTPLLRALTELFGERDYLRYLSAYRYPLSGEFALTSDLALNTRIPGNWGLEIGLLAEVYRNVAHKRISQIDLGVFDHKHQPLGQDTSEGLQKMCADILRSLLRTLTEMEQLYISRDHIHALRVKFRREAQNFTRQYFVDARFNELLYDRHEEEIAIEQFERVILEAGREYADDPQGAQIPDWTRALAVMPDLREALQAACEADMAEAQGLAVLPNIPDSPLELMA